MRQRRPPLVEEEAPLWGEDETPKTKRKEYSLWWKHLYSLRTSHSEKTILKLVGFAVVCILMNTWKTSLVSYHSSRQHRRPAPGKGPKLYNPTDQFLAVTPILPQQSRTTADYDDYDVFHCPDTPPPSYPREYPILDVLRHWNTNDVNPPKTIHQGICIIDVAQMTPQQALRQIQAYRTAEVPFVIRNDPAVRKAVELWSDPEYLLSKLVNKRYHATLSNTTIMTYYSKDPNYNQIPKDFLPPTTDTSMTFEDWLDHATAMVGGNRPHVHDHNHQAYQHVYLRLDACLADKSCDSTYRGNPNHIDNADFIYEDLPFFYSGGNPYYEIDMQKARGIQCRFATPGLTAEAHFDNERNYIAMIGGARRYILAHPQHCANLYLYKQKHPLERHTMVDWSLLPQDDEKLLESQFPNFHKAKVNEVILTEGDVLYLPTYWFHHIISLSSTVNYQCNTRSGYSVEYDQTIYDCGFFYDFPE